MKILFITDNFPPIIDGVGDYTANLSHTFIRGGHRVYIICSSRNQSPAGALHGPDLHVLPVLSGWSIKSILNIATHIKAIQPDYISLQYVPYAFDKYGIPFKLCLLILLLKLSNHKIATTFHEIAIRLDFKKPKYIPIAIIQRIIAYMLALMSNHVITSIEMYINMLSPFKNEIHRIPIGSNILPSACSTEHIATLKTKLKPDNEFLLCTFGANSKRFDILLKAIAELNLNYRIKLVLIGKLPEKVKQELQQQANQLKIAGNLLLTGYLPSEEVYEHLASADAYIQLENIMYKNWGGVSTKSGTLAAAYLAGLPIIATEGDMTDSFFTDGENILLCKNNSLSEIKAKITQLIESDTLRAYLSKNAHDTFTKYLNWENTYKAYCSVLIK